MDIYKASYRSRSPYDIRQNYEMYDPRLVNAFVLASFDTEGRLIDEEGRPVKEQVGIVERDLEELFLTLVQNDIIPLLEANAKLPPERRKSIRELLTQYGIPYPLVVPVLKLTPEEQERFFAKPYDKETLRERYEFALKRDDRQMKPDFEIMKEQRAKEAAAPGKQPNAEAPRSVQ
jgi:hypothetical protein